MQVETYSIKYYDDIVNIVENFHKEALCEYTELFDKAVLMATITDLSKNNRTHSFLLIIDGKCQGLIAGMELPALYNKNRIFQELIWYVNPDFRLNGVVFFNKTMDMLKEEGLNKIIMGVLENSKADKLKELYNRIGLKLFETHWIGDL